MPSPSFGFDPAAADRLREAVFFDLDGTLLARSSMLAVARPLHHVGMVGWRTIVRAVTVQLVHVRTGGRHGRREAALGTAVRGWAVDSLGAALDGCVEATLGPLIRPGAAELITSHVAAGRQVYIASSAPDEIVTRVAALLGIDHVLATRLDARDGYYTGDVVDFCQGDAKADRLRSEAPAGGINLATSYAYADSLSDVPMLEAVGHPHVVHPDRQLEALARRRGWPIIRLDRRSTDAVPAPGGPPIHD